LVSGADPYPLHPPSARLSFLGAAGTVTGSRFLVDTPQARVLVDAGLFQGVKALRLRNRQQFDVAPSSIDAVVLTHAHVDHCGYLPALVAQGFDGPVFCTGETADLAAIVLPDSGHLQEEEASHANRMGYSKHHPAVPLYTEQDAYLALRQIERERFGAEFEVAKGVHATFRPAGHILGSSTVSLRLAATSDRTVLFSGDLGRPHHPLLIAPSPPRRPDVVVMESTYGDRVHDESGSVMALRDAVAATVARGGTVLIPSFAVDRTEVVLHHLRTLVASGELPDVPVYVDSPMALRALGVYRSAIEAGAADIRASIAGDSDPLGVRHATEVHTVEESKALAQLTLPSVIISASGMATGGRVLHHLARLLPNWRNSVVLVGFQARGTRGRLLVDGARSVRMHGREVPVRADVVDLPAFSVHADSHELVAWLDAATAEPDMTYLVHGEPDAAGALAGAMRAGRQRNVVVAEPGATVPLT
jgi:metallo-beta-lactamase family protein